MVAADVKLAVAVLSDAGRLENDLVQADIVAAGQGLDQAVGDDVFRHAGVRLDDLLRRIQLLRADDDFGRRIRRCIRSAGVAGRQGEGGGTGGQGQFEVC